MAVPFPCAYALPLRGLFLLFLPSLGRSCQGVSFKLYPLMLCGRLIFGSGNGSLTIVQNKITAMWFDGKELAMAFGFTLAFSRLGSVLNFLFTEELSERLGIAQTLWFGECKKKGGGEHLLRVCLL